MPSSWQPTRVEISSHFERAFAKLSPQLQKRAIQRINLFRSEPFDYRLKTHRLTDKLAGDWAFSIDQRNRVRFRIAGKQVALLVDVSSHDIYKR